MGYPQASLTLLAVMLAVSMTVAQATEVRGESKVSLIKTSETRDTAGQTSMLRQQFEDARRFDAEYQAALAVRDAAEQGLRFAESNFGPKVTLSSSAFLTERSEGSTNAIGQTTETDRQFKSHLTQIQARQPLYRFRDRVTAEQSGAELEAARQGVLYAEQDLYVRLIGAWIEILAGRDQLASFSEALSAGEEILRESESRYRAGEISVQDLDQVRARVVQSQAQVMDAKAQLDVANQMLQNIVGSNASVPEQFTLMRFLAFKVAPLDSEKLFELVDSKNYEIAVTRFRETAALLERKKAQADSRPTLDAYALVSTGENDNVSSVKDERRIGLQLSVPLYTHGAIDATVAQAEANFRRAQAQTRAVMLRARIDALSAQTSLSALAARVAAADRAHQAAQMMLTALRKGLVAGINSRAEVAQSVQELLTAQRQRSSARQEYAATWLKYQSAVSGFNEELLEAIQAQLRP